MTAPVPAADGAADALYAAYNAHDAAAAALLHAEEGWVEEAATGRRRQGRVAIAEGLARLFAMLPDVVWTERESIRSGSGLVVVYTMAGRLRIDLGPVRGVGQPIVLPSVHVFEMRDGRISGLRDHWDGAEFQRQARDGQTPAGKAAAPA